MIAAVPYAIHTVLTDNSLTRRRPVHQYGAPQIRLPPNLRPGLCRTRHRAPLHQDQTSLDQRPELAPARAELEQMIRTIKEATVKRYHYDSHPQRGSYLRHFIDAYNYSRRSKTPRGLSPLRVRLQMLGPNSYSVLTLDAVARTAPILVRGKERGKRRCSASAPTSDAARGSRMRQKWPRPEGIAQKANMVITSDDVTL